MFSIKDLANDVAHGTPKDLAAEAAAISEGAVERFPELLTAPGSLERSERDQAAHYRPIEPASVWVVFFHGGPVGIELQDAGHGTLPPIDTLDPKRMRRDEPLLTQAIDARLAELHEFCGELIDLAVRAEEHRLGGSRAETTGERPPEPRREAQ